MPFDETDNIGSVSIGFHHIIPRDSAYQIRIIDDLIDCEGTFIVTLPAIAIARKFVWVYSQTETITMAADATIEGISVLTAGVGIMFYPSRGKWRQ